MLFSVAIAEKATNRDDQTYIAGCVYRALCCIAQVLFAVNSRYLINEKGALAETETFPTKIDRMTEAVNESWAAIGTKDFRTGLQLLRNMAIELDMIVERND